MACEYDQHTSEYNSECDSFPWYLPWRTCNTVLFLQLCVLIMTHQVCLSLEVCRYISIRHVSIDERCAKVHQRFQVCHWVCKSGQVRHWVCKAFIYGSLLERETSIIWELICAQSLNADNKMHLMRNLVSRSSGDCLPVQHELRALRNWTRNLRNQN